VNPEDEVLTFDDFDLGDEETPMKQQPTKRTSVAVAVAVAPSGTDKKDKGAYGMQADDFYSEDEDDADVRPAGKIGPEREREREGDPAAAPAPAPAPALTAKAGVPVEKKRASYSSYSPSAKQGAGNVRARLPYLVASSLP
jgi:hypothetical protein